MLGSERGVVEEWLSEFKVNCIEDENVSYDSVCCNSVYIFMYMFMEKLKQKL